MSRSIWILSVLLLSACDNAPEPGVDGGADAGEATCTRACDDGLFCNGEERCAPSSAVADEDGCVAASDPCGPECDEERDRCSDCELNPDVDGDGADAIGCGGDDCDDNDALSFPDATEVCDPGDRDEDCDPTTVGSRDADGDGSISIECCNGDVCGADCNDAAGSVFPGATEVCNGVDDDCDAMVDEEAQLTFYEDADRDDFGSAIGETRMACAEPDGFSANNRDCDDSTSAVNPGLAEVCDAFDDNDCNADTINPFDADGDGADSYNAVSCPAGRDCAPSDPTVYRGAPEICDGQDSDCGGDGVAVCDGPCAGRCLGTCDGACDGLDPVDESCDGICSGTCTGLCSAGCAEASPFLDRAVFLGEDADRDGAMATGETCIGGPLAALPRVDCDDMIATVFEGAPELCDGRDNDCDGRVDEEIAVFPHPNAAIEGEGGSAPPNFTCRGLRSRAAPGAVVERRFAVRSVDSSSSLDPGSIELFASEDASTLDCTEPACFLTVFRSQSFRTTEGSFPENAVLGYRATVDGLATLGFFDVGVREASSPLRRSLYFASGEEGALTARVLDCAGRRVSNAQVRLYFNGGEPSCNEFEYVSGAPVLRGQISPFPVSGVGELVTVEAWGRLTTGGPMELLGRERVRVSSDAATVVTIPPLRADGPPAP